MTYRSEPSPFRSVLLVDGHDDTRHMYAQAFTLAGWRVAQARTAEIAWRLIRRHRFSAAVTELRLAGGADGAAFTRAMRCEIATAHMPVVILSSNAFTSDRDHAVAAGCSRFLAKPCLPDELLRVTRELVEGGATGNDDEGPFVSAPVGTVMRVGRRTGELTGLCDVCACA